LSEIIKAWAKAKRIEDFFDDTERRAEDLGDDEKAMILERLAVSVSTPCIIYRIEQDILTILLIKIGHRREVYR